MAFGKRTDDVIGSVPNKPKLAKYVMMSDLPSNNALTEEKIVKQLELRKEDLFDNFENDEDLHFLSFESEGFIPIEDDFSKIKKLFLDSTNEQFVPISNETQDYEDFLFTVLSQSELINCLTNINPLNLYLTIGFFESESFKGPLFFVPLILENNNIKRDYNKEIKFNYFLKSELENEENIVLPEINLNVEEYINELKKFSDFKISNKSYVGNFYFRNLLIYNDLTISNWYNSYDKFKSFLKNEHIYSIEEFKNLNNDIAKKWPSLNLNYEKDLKMKGADKLITNLLSEGNSILYVSNYYSKNEVKKSLTNKYLNSLILDFDYNLDKYSIFNDVGENLLNFNDKKNISMLTEKKIFYENMFNILKNNYSDLDLTPFEIKEKRDEFLQYKYDLNLDINESLLNNIGNLNEEIKDISKNTNLINIIVNSKDFNLSNEEFEKFNVVHDSIQKDILDFETINQNLNKKYGLLVFDNLVLPQYLENFNFINEESKYLIKEDYDKINEFLKVSHDYQNLKNDGSIVFTKKINNYSNNIINQKNKLESFNDKFDEVKSLVEYLDISNSSFEESIKYLALLFNHPKIIENEEKLYEIVKVIEKYRVQKDFEGLLIDQLKHFWDENDEINNILDEYHQYLNNNSENLIVYDNIKNVSNLFDGAGFNFKTFNEYFSLKDKLNSFKNAEYVENKSYFELNDNLKEFLTTYDDSLNNYLNNSFSQLTDIFNDIKDIIHNRYSASYKEDLFNNITGIMDIQKNLGFAFDNFKELDDNKDFIKYLNNNPDFDLNFDNESLVDNFEKINELNISGNIQDFIDFRINDYVSILKDIIDLAEGYLKDNYDWIYIKRNIQEILEIKDKLGINYNSINDFRNNENVLDILIQNPKLNYTIEDYELYLNIYKICQEYGKYDIDDLLKSLNKEYEKYLKSINDEIKPILNEEYDLIFIKDKINEIKEIIDNLSELINCAKIDKFNEIDDFIKNIQILKHKPTFIENYDDFYEYIETIEFLKNPNLLDERFLTECSLKLVDFKDLPFENKIPELKNIIDLCYENNTSIYLLNTKKHFNNLMEKINNLNIECNIVDDLDLEECIDSLKPKYTLINENHKRKLNTHNNNIEKSILKKIDSINSSPSSRIYDLKSKNYNLNKESKDNILFNDIDNNEIYNYLKNKNVSKEEIINDLKLLDGYLDNFNDLYDEISEYIYSNLKNIKECSAYEELYYNKIEGVLEISCPNSFRGLESNIDDLKNEFENNKYFTQLVESSFFNDTSYDHISFDEINKQIEILIKSKNELIDLCYNSDFNLDDTFENILNYINYLLSDIKIFKDSNDKILVLNYLKEYLSEELLFKFDSLNKDIIKLSNLDDQFIKKYFKENYGLKVKDNIKLVDKFNNLIKNNVFTDNTIKFLENTSQEDIENEINKLKININSVYLNLVDKDFNFDDKTLTLVLDKIEKIINFNLKFKNEIDETSYLLKLINFDNYDEYARKFSSFITKHNSKLNLNNQCKTFKEIVSELDSLNEIYADENYRNTLFNFDSNQINDELLKLKNNLIYNNLVKLDKIKVKIPKTTSDLIFLIDETKELINENDYNVTFDELIEDNETVKVEMNKFDRKFDEILERMHNNSFMFLDIVLDVENLFAEYSIPLNKKFINFNKDISQNSDLIRLCFSLNKSLLKLSKTELNEYAISMDINKEFSNLIDSNIFSKSVCEFYNNENYEDKLVEMENLSLNIAGSLNKRDLDKNIVDIVNSDIEKIYNDYSEIIELKEKDSNNSNELIDNYLVILEGITNLYNNKPFITDYSLDILKINEKLDNLSTLYDFEVEIQDNEELIEKHFSGIVNSNSPNLINDLYKKIELDLEFTRGYNENIFSDKTIKNSESLQPIDLSFDKSILKLYNSNDYQEIYDKNKVLINEIINFENGITKQREFLSNVNELLSNDDLDSLLKLDINSKLDEYESRLADLSEINQKYFSDSDSLLIELKNHIAFTEIIENKIFNDERLIKSNLKDISEELNELNKIYYSLLNNLYKISEFYLKNPYFDIDQNSFNYEISFETLKNNLDIFERDLNDINRINDLPSIVISLVLQLNEQNIDFSKMEGIFNYNVYNEILTNFYEDFPEVEGKNLDYNKYKKDMDKIDKQINKNRFNQVLAEIYANIHKNANNESILNQKETLNQIISNKTMGTIKETLNEFKEYILNVKPIFMMDINQFYEYIGNEYESLFDYVILDKNFEFEELDSLALFLRSKNKLIDLR